MRHDDMVLPAGLAAGAISIVLFRRCRLSDLEFAICLGSLVVALALLLGRSDEREGFFESAADVLQEALLPKLNKLALSFHKSEKGEDDPKSEEGKEPEENSVEITDDYLHKVGVPQSLADSLKLQDKRISFFLCNLKEADDTRYDKLMEFFSA